MAERRMFSKRIINTAKFLKMPPSTQNLYFHLGINADDDGIVEAYNVLQTVGATEDDLKILVAKELVQVLNEDLVTYIVDWTENNKLRADRKIDSIYKELLLKINPDAKLLESRERADRTSINNGTSNGQPMDRIGKDRLGKDSIVQNNINIHEQNFEIFWSKYPKKVSKEKARKAFFKINFSDVVFSEVLKALDKFINSNDWKKDNGQFIPYPATWLNQKRWEDETIDTTSIIKIENKSSLDPDVEARFKESAGDIYGQ